MGKAKISNKELQKIELEILQAFHDFCEKNNLKYYLAGGTLIGAIRHKGFIPWDDDIDICMPRPDYDRLLKICSSSMIGKHYKIDSNYYDDSIPTTMVRIYDTRTEITFDNFRIPYTIGCWVDIFPLDGLDDDEGKRKIHFKEMRLVMDMFICCLTKFGGKRRSKFITCFQYLLLPFVPIIRGIGYKRWIRLYNKIASKYDYNKSNYVGVLAGRGEEKEAMLKKNMEPRILVDFEDRKFYSMANYDEYLTNLYGDYMTPPPKSEQTSSHQINVYWKDKDNCLL